MKELLSGVSKFCSDVFPEKTSTFKKLEGGQTPHTLFITCSDSRIAPNLVTQTDPGQIFVIRNAGNIVPPYGASRGGEEATIEYAVDGLKVKNIVICGHSHCGAMSALLDKTQVVKMPAVHRWLDHAESTLRRLGSATPSVDEAVKTNVLTQVENLKTHPSVSSALSENRISIFAWVYRFESGAVLVHDGANKTFVPLSEVSSTDLTRFNL